MANSASKLLDSLLDRDAEWRDRSHIELPAFKTGTVLEAEFKLIHGEARWDPRNPTPRQGERLIDRAAFIDQARAHVPPPTRPEDHDETERYAQSLKEAERLATHAWSAANLPGAGQAALCLSGGGIRSGAFALGMLQGLARKQLLPKFHYLSTVSGGGYIGSWLTAWSHREGRAAALAGLELRKFGEFTEPAQMQRLRFNQNFLTPKVGLGSADTWAAFGTVLRNLLLNWLVFLPLLSGLLIVPRIVQAFLIWMQDYDPKLLPRSSLIALFQAYLWVPHNSGERITEFADLGGWAGWRSWLDSIAVLLILLGFCLSAYNRPASGRSSMTQTRFVLWVVCPVMAGAILLTAAVATWESRFQGSASELLRWVFFGGAVYLTARVIAALCAIPRFASVPAFHKGVFPLELAGWAVAGMCTGLLVGVGAQILQHLMLPHGSSPGGLFKHDLSTLLAAFGPPWIVSCFLVGEMVYVGIASRLPYGERDREWLARAAGWFGIVVVSYLVFSCLVLFGWAWIRKAEIAISVAIGGSGLAAILGALTPLTRASAASAAKEKLPITGIVTVLAGLFVLGASALLAQATLDTVGQVGRFLHYEFHIPVVGGAPDDMFAPLTQLGFEAGTAIGLLLISAAISFFVNINLFSLHAFYRNRLVKTFLGASNVAATPEAEGRNVFDGSSERDNIAMAELYGKMEVGEVELYPVLNMSLNVLATKNLAWQERKAEPFVCTPFFTGSDHVGYRQSALYSAGARGSLDAPQRGISLGTAMAISGAAVSPNWGYHSSPITSFLMMLANVRLGYWLGNPKNRHKAWRYRGPRLSWRLFLQEALGWTDDNEPWVYLSDGGHFENLG
ncbi:MAG TPA: patatin-like phospholipase family protein, partial [Stellaceae bacterium]|nr:patatin-like phospholipase family protein [Stellaceae bacterium]